MLAQLENHRQKWIGVLAILISYFTILAMAAPLLAQTTVLGELTFKGASKVEKHPACGLTASTWDI
jgi:hypothetical protein